jgi:RNA polymerase sigma-70 factor (sigma-E family)
MTDDESFREFVTMRWPALVRTAYLLTGDHGRAEDLVQTTLEKMHRHWRRIATMESPEGYARRVMTNLAISGSRRKRFREVSMVHAPEVGAEDGSQSRAEREVMWQVLQQLPPRVRAVMVLRFFEDLSEADIARILECTPGTVKSQHSRGLAKLRALLAKNDVFPPPESVPVPVMQPPPATNLEGTRP